MLLGTCGFRLSTPKSTEVGSESAVPRTPLETTGSKLSNSSHPWNHISTSGLDALCNNTPPNGHRSKRLFHIHDDDESEWMLSWFHESSDEFVVALSPPVRQAGPTSSLLTPPATLPRRRHLSYAPQTPPVPLTERASFRTRVSSTPSNDIRRTRKGPTNRRYASEACEENLVPKKEVWDTSFELLLYNLSKSRSRNSSLAQPHHPRFDVSSPISPLAPSPLIDSS